MPKARKPVTVETGGRDTFYDDLKKFRAKYPMCYIEAWTPEDFDRDENGGEVENSNWELRLWNRIAARLGFEFDAEVGTNWTRVEEVVRRLRPKT